MVVVVYFLAGTFGVWVPRRADDAEVFVVGCPSRFASADGHNWEALRMLGSKAGVEGAGRLGGGPRIAPVARAMLERSRRLRRVAPSAVAPFSNNQSLAPRLNHGHTPPQTAFPQRLQAQTVARVTSLSHEARRCPSFARGGAAARASYDVRGPEPARVRHRRHRGGGGRGDEGQRLLAAGFTLRL